MTNQEANELFDATILPYVRQTYEQDGIPDWPARNKAWNNWTDALCKDGTITETQYNEWTYG